VLKNAVLYLWKNYGSRSSSLYTIIYQYAISRELVCIYAPFKNVRAVQKCINVSS